MLWPLSPHTALCWKCSIVLHMRSSTWCQENATFYLSWLRGRLRRSILKIKFSAIAMVCCLYCNFLTESITTYDFDSARQDGRQNQIIVVLNFVRNFFKSSLENLHMQKKVPRSLSLIIKLLRPSSPPPEVIDHVPRIWYFSKSRTWGKIGKWTHSWAQRSYTRSHSTQHLRHAQQPPATNPASRGHSVLKRPTYYNYLYLMISSFFCLILFSGKCHILFIHQS